MTIEFRLPCKVLICGDSISAGIMYDDQAKRYVKSAEGFVNVLQNSLNCVVKNISRFGNTILTAVPKLKKNLESEKPDVVLIELGGNDCDFKWDQIALNPKADWQPATSVAEFQSALQGIISTLREKGIAPVLTTLPPLDPERYFNWISKNSRETGEKILEWLGSVSRIYWWHERYNAAVLQVAEHTKTVWIDLRGAFLSTPDFRCYLCRDGIHPNREGHRLIASEITAFLEQSCPMLLKPAALS